MILGRLCLPRTSQPAGRAIINMIKNLITGGIVGQSLKVSAHKKLSAVLGKDGGPGRMVKESNLRY